MCTGATVTEGWPQLRDPNPNAMPPSPDSDITSPMQAAKHLALAWQTGSMQQMIDPQSHDLLPAPYILHCRYSSPINIWHMT